MYETVPRNWGVIRKGSEGRGSTKAGEGEGREGMEEIQQQRPVAVEVPPAGQDWTGAGRIKKKERGELSVSAPRAAACAAHYLTLPTDRPF